MSLFYINWTVTASCYSRQVFMDTQTFFNISDSNTNCKENLFQRSIEGLKWWSREEDDKERWFALLFASAATRTLPWLKCYTLISCYYFCLWSWSVELCRSCDIRLFCSFLPWLVSAPVIFSVISICQPPSFCQHLFSNQKSVIVFFCLFLFFNVFTERMLYANPWMQTNNETPC